MGNFLPKMQLKKKMELNINCSRTQKPKINMTTIIILD